MTKQHDIIKKSMKQDNHSRLAKEYYDWLQKFEKRSTSDDTFTPPAVYDIVLDYVDKHILNLDDKTVERPFYPDGDYTDLSQYDENSIVIDNPPFSLSARIYKFYQEHNIKFFLFAPALTVLSPMRHIHGITAVIAPAKICYDNGAMVDTAFVTNLCGSVRAMTAPALHNALKALEQQKPKLPKYQYPPNVLMANSLNKLCQVGIEFSVSADESAFIGQLESQKEHKKILFGGGLLVSDDKAKELQAKELQAKELQAKNNSINWELSDAECAIVESLG